MGMFIPVLVAQVVPSGRPTFAQKNNANESVDMAGLKWNENTIARLIKEGYGQGAGEKYKAWLDVRSFSSHGITYRVNGVTVCRPYTLLSKEEYRLFMLLDQRDNIEDIREQFPL